MLEEREKKIKDSLDQAERHRSEAERKLREYEAKLATAAKDSEAILARRKSGLSELMEENEQRMTAEAERIKGDATREIDHERRKAIQDIRTQTTDLALMVAEKVVSGALRKRIIGAWPTKLSTRFRNPHASCGRRHTRRLLDTSRKPTTVELAAGRARAQVA